MDLRELLDNPPLVHDYGGKLHSWSLPPEVQQYIAEHVHDGSRTLETGAGASTVLFALCGAMHTCITPDREEVERIKEYCHKHGLSLAKVDFQFDRSDNVLMRSALAESPLEGLDLTLIDGCHGFPTPFLDWYFLSQRLMVGGTLIIDDTQLWTGRVLRDFLLQEPEWSLHEACAPCIDKTAIFVKRAEYQPWKEWNAQPYVEQNSRADAAPPADSGESSGLRKAIRLLRRGPSGH